MPDSIRLSGSRGRFGMGPKLKPVATGAPWTWLQKGWEDFTALKGLSVLYGGVFAVISALLMFGLFRRQLASLSLALAGGFLIVAPLAATGLYETARRRAAGLEVGLKHMWLAQVKSPAQIRLLGVGLVALYLVWMELAFMLLAVFFGATGLPSVENFLPELLFTWHGIGLLVIGSAIGGALAFVAFAATALSIPMLVARDMDAISAVVCSVRTVTHYPRAMLLWAWLIALFTAFGIVTLGFGLVITFPLIGYASWHAYADVIED